MLILNGCARAARASNWTGQASACLRLGGVLGALGRIKVVPGRTILLCELSREDHSFLLSGAGGCCRLRRIHERGMVLGRVWHLLGVVCVEWRADHEVAIVKFVQVRRADHSLPSPVRGKLLTLTIVPSAHGAQFTYLDLLLGLQVRIIVTILELGVDAAGLEVVDLLAHELLDHG